MSDLSDYDNYFKRCDENESHNDGMGYNYLDFEVSKIKKKLAILTNEKKRPYFYTDLFSMALSAGLGGFTSFAVFCFILRRS
jgi:hypothetical protein